jgi:soluble lytic murein transglycosylase-like protein
MKNWFSRRSRWGIIAVLAVVALPCLASEVAVLKNGFSIRHERRVVVGDVTRLYVNADGSSYVDIPTTEIEHFEAAPELPASEIAPFVKNAKGGAATSHAASGGTSYSPVAAGNGRPVRDLSQVVDEASGRYRLDPDLVNSVIKAESGFNVRAVSPKGAQGLMQLMPGTASQLGVPNAFDARANVDGGARYLRELLERYNFDMVKALAAYNAGPERVEQFGGVPPYHETRAYVARIVRDFNKKKVAQEKAAAAQAKVPAKSASRTQTPAAKPHGSTAVAQAGSNASQARQ